MKLVSSELELDTVPKQAHQLTKTNMQVGFQHTKTTVHAVRSHEVRKSLMPHMVTTGDAGHV